MYEYPKAVSKQSTKKILDQINNSLYKLNGKYVGFFCYIKYKNHNIPVLITTCKILEEDNNINVTINDEKINLEFEETKYLNKYYDLYIIELKNKNLEGLEILDIDDILYKENSEEIFSKETMYIIHYNNQNENCVTFGVVNNIINEKLMCSFNIKSNVNGSPIFNINNNKIIGIYKNNSKYYNNGIFFKFIINEFKEFKKSILLKKGYIMK